MIDALDEYVARRRRRRFLAAGALLLLAAVAFWLQRHPDRVRSWLRGPDLRLEAALRPLPPSVLHGVDLRAVHSALLPAWWLPISNHERRGSASEASAAAEALQAALEPDPELLARFAALRGAVQGDVWSESEAVLDAARAWSDYLDRQGAPWFIEASVLQAGGRAVLLVKSYEVVGDVQLGIGERPQRVRLMRRVDGTNVVEGFLGHSGDEGRGALLAVDRITEFAADVVWPMLAADAAPADPIEGVFAAPVRAEAERALSPEHLALLRETAPLRGQLLATLDRVHERRHCHHTTLTTDWLGLAGTQLAWARTEARAERRTACPVLYPVEAQVLEEASLGLQGTAGLEDAFGALLAWVSRGTAVHEARHVADGRFRKPASEDVDALPCPGCPPDFPESARGELSAYLAAFAADGVAYTQLLQACRTAAATLGGQHFAAMELVAAAWGLDGCWAPPPDDLAQQARDLESALFGRDEPVRLPTDYPAWLPPSFNNNRARP